MERVTYKIAYYLSEMGHIQKSDIDICRYGIEVFIISVLEVASLLFISLFAGNFIYTLLFLCSFLPVRVYGGGYHADTRLRCYLLFLAVYALFSIAVRFEPHIQYGAFLMIIPVLSLAAVTLWAPLSGKTVNERERKKYRRVSIGFATAEAVIVICSVPLDFYNIYTYIIILGTLTMLLSMIAGKLKNTLRRK